MVDRFKFASAWNGGSRFVEGETYVRASDYDAAEASIRELEAVLREWRDVQCDQVMNLPFMKRVDAALAPNDKENK